MTIKSTNISKATGRESFASVPSEEEVYGFANAEPIVHATPIGEPYDAESTTHVPYAHASGLEPTSQYSTSTFGTEVERPTARIPVAYSTGVPPRPPPTTYVSTGNNVQPGPNRRRNDQDCCNRRMCCCITLIVTAVITICCILPVIIVFVAAISVSTTGNIMDEITDLQDWGN